MTTATEREEAEWQIDALYVENDHLRAEVRRLTDELYDERARMARAREALGLPGGLPIDGAYGERPANTGGRQDSPLQDFHGNFDAPRTLADGS